MKKSLSIAYILTFSLFFLIPILCSDFSSTSAVLESEKRMQAPFPRLITDSGEVNPKLKQELSSWLDDRIGLRQYAIKTHSEKFMSKWGDLAHPFVSVGKEGFLFFIPEQNIEIGRGSMRVNEDDLQTIVENQKRIAAYMESKGAKYVLVLTPSKSSVYADKLTSKPVSDFTVCDQLGEYLAAQLDFPVLNMKPALMAARKRSSDLLYFKDDTHWNQRGVYVAYQELIAQFNQLGIVSGPACSAHCVQEELRVGDLRLMLGQTSQEAGNPAPVMQIENSASVPQVGESLQQMKAIVESYHHKGAVYYITNDTIDKKTLLILGDSMWGAGIMFPQYLSQHFSSIVYVCTDSQCFYPDLIDLVKPDVVIYGVTERFQPIRMLIDPLASDSKESTQIAP